jgi:hypothetical protein
MLAATNPNRREDSDHGEVETTDAFKSPLFASAVQPPLRGSTPYVLALRSSAIVLCPAGDDFETFRFWEALVAGAIPITVKPSDPDVDFISRPGSFSSETWANLSKCPFPQLESWEELPALMDHLFSDDADQQAEGRSGVSGEASVSVVDVLQVQLVRCFQDLRSGVREDLRAATESLFPQQLVQEDATTRAPYHLRHETLEERQVGGGPAPLKGPFGQELLAEQWVNLPSASFAVRLFRGDEESDDRMHHVVSAACDGMAVSHGPFLHQCDSLRIRMKELLAESLVSTGVDTGTTSWSLPALCIRRERGQKRRRASFTVLGDSHTRVWRLAAARTSVPFFVAEAMGATAYGLASRHSKSGARQLFEEVLARHAPTAFYGEESNHTPPNNSTVDDDAQSLSTEPTHVQHLVIMLGEVDIGSAAWFRKNNVSVLSASPPFGEAADVQPYLLAAAERLFEWLEGATARYGFHRDPAKVVVLGATLPTVEAPWLNGHDDDDSDGSGSGGPEKIKYEDASERRHVASSRSARSQATRAFNGLLKAGAEQRGFRYADIAGPTTNPATGLLDDARYHSRGLHYDIHLDAFATYTHWLAALASAVGGEWCDRSEEEDEEERRKRLFGESDGAGDDCGGNGESECDSGGGDVSQVQNGHVCADANHAGCNSKEDLGRAGEIQGKWQSRFYSNARGEFHDRFVKKDGTETER